MPGIVDNKIRDLSILISRKNKYIGREMNYKVKIIDSIHIKGLQNFERQANILNTVNVDIKNDEPWSFAAWYRNNGYSYRFIIESLLFSVGITNGFKTIFITCNGWNSAKATIIHDGEFKTVVVVNLGEIMAWTLVKRSSNWVGATLLMEIPWQRQAILCLPLNLAT